MIGRMQGFTAKLVMTTLTWITACQFFPVSLQAQVPVGQDLQITIIDGGSPLNNIRTRTAREPIVEVRGRNNRPVAGAFVTFTLPKSGPGGTFLNGTKVFTAPTDQDGRASASVFRANQHKGKYQMQVRASLQGLTGNTVIAESNVAAAVGAAGAAGGLFGIGIPATVGVIGAAAAATAVGIVKSVSGGGGKKATISVAVPRFP